jgi:hypothetical protein
LVKIKKSKTMKKISIPFLACTFLSVPAQAALIAYDGFNYSAGANALAGNNGGTGFSGVWTNRDVTSTGWSVLSTGLTFSDLPVTGGRIQGTSTLGGGHSEVMRDLTTNLSGSQVYGSFLYATNQPHRTLTVAGLQIGNSADARNTQTVQAYPDEWDQTVGVRQNGTGGGSTGSTLTIDVTYLVLFSANLVNTSPTATMWVLNSAQFDTLKSGGLTEAELNSAAVGTGSSNIWAKSTVVGANRVLGITNNVNFLAFSGYSGAPEIAASFDELRIGTTLASVIPEPSSALLGGLGLLALLRRRR